MNLLPQTYLLGLVGLLAIVAVVVGQQFFRVRRDEAVSYTHLTLPTTPYV